MGWDIDRFPEGEVNLELICCICTCILEDPVESPCRHVFCSQCIKTWLSNQKSCPHCRAPVHKRDLQSVVPLLKNIISKQKIYCDNKERGCVEVVALENLQGHIASCSYGLVACSYEGCTVKVLRKDHKVHSDLCTKRTVMCEQGCEMFLTLGERNSHNCIRSLRSHFQDVSNEILGRISKLEELVNDLVSKNMSNTSNNGTALNNHRNQQHHRSGGRSSNHQHRGGDTNNPSNDDHLDCVSYNIPSPRSPSYDAELPPYTVLADANQAINVDNYDAENNEFSDSFNSVESDSALNNSDYLTRDNLPPNRGFRVSSEREMSPVYDHLDRTYGSLNGGGRESRRESRRQRQRSRSPHGNNTYTASSRTSRHSRHTHRRNNRSYELEERRSASNEQEDAVILQIGVSETVSDSSSSSSSSTESDTD